MLQLLPHENAGLMVSLCLGTKTTCLELGKKKKQYRRQNQDTKTNIWLCCHKHGKCPQVSLKQHHVAVLPYNDSFKKIVIKHRLLLR